MIIKIDYISPPKNELNHVHIYGYDEVRRYRTFTSNEGRFIIGDKVDVPFDGGEPVYSELKKVEAG